MQSIECSIISVKFDPELHSILGDVGRGKALVMSLTNSFMLWLPSDNLFSNFAVAVSPKYLLTA